MKRLVIIGLCLLVAVAACAKNPADKVARDVMFTNQAVPRTNYEGFETSVPPPGWTLVQTNVNETWFQDCEIYTDPVEGSCAATCLYDAGYTGPQDEWLKFNYTLQTGDNMLYFFALASTYWAIDPYQNYNIIVTIDGVEVWNYYDDNAGAVTWQWQLYGVDLSAYSVGQTIEVGFGYVGYDGAQASLDAISFGEPWEFPPPLCPTDNLCYVVDFNLDDQGFATQDCGIGPPPWQWGAPVSAYVPTVACDDVPVTHTLATIIGGYYPVSTGGAAVLGPFDITEACSIMELCHYYDIEGGYDGGNVKVSTDGGLTWHLVVPERGYDDILDSTSYIAECVHGQEVFTGWSGTFIRDCFDLTDYIGQSIMVGFFFGADSLVTYDGWYIKWVKIGGNEYNAIENSSWGAIKAMYK
jgi:hypothetical protein